MIQKETCNMTKIDQKIERLKEILKNSTFCKTKTEYEDTIMLLSWLNELKEYREEYARSLGYEDEGGDKIEVDFDNDIDDDFDEEEFDDDLDDILEEIEKEKAQQSIINAIFFNQPLSIEGIRYLKCIDPELEEELMDLIFTIKDLKDATKKTK